MAQHLINELDEWKNKLEIKKNELEELNIKAKQRREFLDIKARILKATMRDISVTKQQGFAEKYITPTCEELDKLDNDMNVQRPINDTEIRELEAMINRITITIESLKSN